MVTILLCVISVWLPYINGVNVESLRAHSPIFGLSLLADGNTSVCRQEFSDLRDAVIQSKVWGLKGNFCDHSCIFNFLRNFTLKTTDISQSNCYKDQNKSYFYNTSDCIYYFLTAFKHTELL